MSLQPDMESVLPLYGAGDTTGVPQLEPNNAACELNWSNVDAFPIEFLAVAHEVTNAGNENPNSTFAGIPGQQPIPDTNLLLQMWVSSKWSAYLQERC